MKSLDFLLKKNEQASLLMRGIKTLNQMARGVTVIQICKALFKSIIPYIAIYMSSLILTELVSGRDIRKLILYVAFTLLSTLVSVILDSVFGYFVKLDYAKVIAQQEIALNNKTYSMDYEQAERKQTNNHRSQIEISSKAYSGGLRVLMDLCDSLFQGIFSVLIAIIMCAEMFFVSYKGNLAPTIRFVNTGWFSIILLLLIIIALVVLGRAQVKVQQKSLLYNRNMSRFNLWAEYYQNSYFEENKAAKDIRIFNQASFILRDYYNNVLRPNWNIAKEFFKTRGHTQTITAAVTAGIGGVVYLFVAFKAWGGIIEVGEVVRYYGAITQLFAAFSLLITTILSVLNNNEYLKLFFSYLDLPSQSHHGTLPTPDHITSMAVCFDHVSFRYGEDAPFVLRDISLTLEPGEHIAIVGMNGSGKTTLIKLLCRFYEPTFGKITLNGIDIKEYDYTAYKQLLSVVFQDYRLFSFPVGQNVAGNLTFDIEAVWQALALSGISNRIETFPKKLEQPLYKDYQEDGIDVSGGEEQKIALARAIYKDAPFMILDEPTASLDPFSEAEIYEKFNRIVSGRTAIYISHRLASCKFCDRIVVFDHGRIVQTGTHEKLLQDASGKYAELWEAQAQYYRNRVTR